MSDFFDQDTGRDFDDDGMPMNDAPDGANVLINGSHQPLEVGAPFLPSLQNVARQAGLGKFRVWLNGTEVRPTTAPDTISANDRIEIRPFDEAG